MFKNQDTSCKILNLISGLLIIFSLECFISGYIAYNFVIGAYSYWGPKAGYAIYNMVCMTQPFSAPFLNKSI
jgi:hypothetical protein